MPVLLPEIIFRKYLLEIITEIQNDLIGFCELIFGELEPVGQFDIKTEMKTIFQAKPPYNIKMGINIDTAKLPAIHIYLPKEDYFFYGIGGDPEFTYYDADESVKEENNIMYDVTYTLMIVDNNADKVLIIYNVLKYMFHRYLHVLELEGFETIKISGNDLITEQNIIPATIFARNLTFNFKYPFSTQNAIVQLVGGNLVIDNKDSGMKSE